MGAATTRTRWPTSSNHALFCLFAEDAGLLPAELFTRLVDNGRQAPAHFATLLGNLFGVMSSGGPFGVEVIDWFNGGLFDSAEVLPLQAEEIDTLLALARLDWSAIEPSIFGTLFERGLDPDKRSQLGAHYTDPGSIMRIVKPVVVEPLQNEWAGAKAQIAGWLDKARKAKSKPASSKAHNEAERVYQGFLSRLAHFRVLDPACGSGNFLYLALGALKGGVEAGAVHSDLTASKEVISTTDLTRARRLPENAGLSFMATTKGGAFDIHGETARQMLKQPNPHGRANAAVVKPWANGLDVTRRPRDMWIIDFGTDTREGEAALFEAPFQYLVDHVKEVCRLNRREAYARYWWRFVESRSAMREKLAPLARFIATPRVAKYRLFVWLDSVVLPDSQLIVVARADHPTFGILHSRFHELWALRMGTSLEDRPRYTPTTTFETFPFPEGLTPDLRPEDYANPAAAAIAEAARELVRLRDNWLNPPEWVRRVPEVVPGYPDRLLPVDEAAAKELKQRTLTNLYNRRPAWLDNAHQALDAAVATAYGWHDYSPDMPEAEILSRLLALNLARPPGLHAGKPCAVDRE